MALLHVQHYSAALEMNMPMDVILPESAHDRSNPETFPSDKRWPVLYLLHGMSDDHTIWQRRTSIERYAADKGLAVIMPTTHLGWYTDMAAGPRYWTYITGELPLICRDLFPCITSEREQTFAAGLSMGGYGALKCGLRAGKMFSYIAALSALTDIAERMETLEDRANRGYWADIFGEPSSVRGSNNDLFAAASECSPEYRPHIYQWCGTEDFLYQQNLKFRDHLRALGYDLTYEESPGDHQWKYWDAKIQTVLDWLPLGKEKRSYGAH